jgi:alpha-galactosidase
MSGIRQQFLFEVLMSSHEVDRGPKSQEISMSWTEIGYPQHVAAQVRDLWAHKDLGKLIGKFSAEVPSHGVVMVTVKP